jgi:CheY-like chemotaxis protein
MNANHHRILVAEDNDAMLRLITRRLQSDQHEVLQARSGHELMHWVELSAKRDAVPLLDLVVADHRMPGPTGLQCLLEFRSRGGSAPWILISAFGDAQLHEAALAGGARAVLDKPLDFQQLRTAVWSLL